MIYGDGQDEPTTEGFLSPVEHQVFDDSVDPYDRRYDSDYDDGIAGSEEDDDDEFDDEMDTWDTVDLDDQTKGVREDDEMIDFDELEDD